MFQEKSESDIYNLRGMFENSVIINWFIIKA